jgi:hypothetical protein
MDVQTVRRKPRKKSVMKSLAHECELVQNIIDGFADIPDQERITYVRSVFDQSGLRGEMILKIIEACQQSQKRFDDDEETIQHLETDIIEDYDIPGVPEYIENIMGATPSELSQEIETLNTLIKNSQKKLSYIAYFQKSRFIRECRCLADIAYEIMMG